MHGVHSQAMAVGGSPDDLVLTYLDGNACEKRAVRVSCAGENRLLDGFPEDIVLDGEAEISFEMFDRRI